MREILFRGKRKDSGEWVEGFLLKECNYLTCSWNLGIEYKTDRFGKFAYDVAEINPETVGQFTGLIDKNGEKIFEGDIVNILPEVDEIGVIEWADDEAMFELNEGGWCANFDNYLPEDVEVIGNIHDNPDLLEGGAEDG